MCFTGGVVINAAFSLPSTDTALFTANTISNDRHDHRQKSQHTSKYGEMSRQYVSLEAVR